MFTFLFLIPERQINGNYSPTIDNRLIGDGTLISSPAPVPQHGGIHQVDENKVAITSSGNRVTFLCICSRLSTKARDAPTVKRTRPRRRRLAARTLCKEPYADLSTEDMMDIISPALDANQLAPEECFASTFDAQEQLQQRSSRLDIWHFGTAWC